MIQRDSCLEGERFAEGVQKGEGFRPERRKQLRNFY